MTEDGLPADVLAEIEADVARYRVMRINAAKKRIAKAANPKRVKVDVSLEEQASIVRRLLAGRSQLSIARSMGWSPGVIGDSVCSFAFAFLTDSEIEGSLSGHRGVEGLKEVFPLALSRFERGDQPAFDYAVRRVDWDASSAGHRVDAGRSVSTEAEDQAKTDR